MLSYSVHINVVTVLRMLCLLQAFMQLLVVTAIITLAIAILCVLCRARARHIEGVVGGNTPMKRILQGPSARGEGLMHELQRRVFLVELCWILHHAIHHIALKLLRRGV